MFSRRREGTSLRPAVIGPQYDSGHGRASFVDAAAIIAAGALNVFLVNRAVDADAEVAVGLRGGAIEALDGGEILTGDPAAANSFEQPDAVAPCPFAEAAVSGGRADVKLPPLSVAALTFRLG
jgi:alpha-N-arabinofuranosidase